MGVLSNLEPGRVFAFFEEITRIPHGSGNVDQISDYLVAFAGERGIFCRQDELKNVIMIKEASEGYEEEPPVILQGHMDMVAVSTADCPLDLKKDGLRVAVKGDDVYAEGTSLGGDDGIAVAYALAFLDDDTLKHPRLEVILTVDEEVGMEGAAGIDLSLLTGNRMINLDSEEEGIFTVSCAGGARAKCCFPVSREAVSGSLCRIRIGGLAGGHSGVEIQKERANANVLLGRVLWRLAGEIPYCLEKLRGGVADNAIPTRAEAVILIPADPDADAPGACAGREPSSVRGRLEELLSRMEEELRAEYAVRDPGLFLEREWLGEGCKEVCSAEATGRLAAFLAAVPNGVQAMSPDMPGLVETSLNLGILRDEDGILAEFSVRSSVESEKDALLEKLAALVRLSGGSMSVSGSYPGWQLRRDSPLRDKMVALFEEMYGKKPEIAAIHAGLECGLLGSKIPDLDCVSIGPDMRNIHTTEETLGIASTARVWEFLVRLLERRG